MDNPSQPAGTPAPDNPGPFRLQKVANFGTGEPWVARIQLGISEISMPAFSTPEAHKEFNDAWFTAGLKLGEAFGTLVELRRITANPETPTLDLSRSYNSFYSLLWAAYKDRWQIAMKLMGFDMGFLFVAQSKFESKFAEFAVAHPNLPIDAVKQMAIDDRQSWQNKLGNFRNQEIEHRAGNQAVEFFANMKSAEVSFANVWHTMEDWAVSAIGESVKPPMYIFTIPKAERDPAKPQKFKLGFDTSAPPVPEEGE
jgi:hypothetical protein